ncbi:DISARM system phospholipase D-like protein DrmC [Laspinema olomoucense]|uniref:DISARM system phospholipase D-like protein DrmC n=1 Tax=Laspinema olomoucense D3b TaxID=2953688 RepID=A0ABT2N4V2_9CYAN|nr:DISARM system phospholipase D-like protein DrmC [Laspinema sp. D3b]MCT7977719.1 DISARM system phospholipase D-like protein DrmC [Laspinema sp. D3b]
MTTPLAEQIYRVASILPPAALNALVDSLSCESWGVDAAQSDRLLNQFPNSKFRRIIGDLLAAWQQESDRWDSRSLALALESARQAIASTGQALDVELVWTGPQISALPVRRTDRVLLQLIEQTQQELTIVSFAVYKIPEVSAAIGSALDRGVKLRIIAETPTSGGGKIPFGVTEALGTEILHRAQVFVWPLEKRPKDSAGRSGSLHIKAVICDRQHLFITSANLTEYALSLNLELGVLVHSPTLAHQVIDLLDNLIHQGHLVKA